MANVKLALKLFALVFMARAVFFFFYPQMAMDQFGYPGTAVAPKKGWGKNKNQAPGIADSEVDLVCTLVQFYGLAQQMLAAQAIAAARAGHTYTQGVVATGLGLVTLLFCLFGTVKLGEAAEVIGFEMEVVYKLLAPNALVGAYALYAGATSLDGGPAGQAVGRSGKAMQLVGSCAVVQGALLMVFTDDWLAKFSVGDDTDAKTNAILAVLAPMWGLCVLGGAVVRLGVVHAGHASSVYQANRASALYYAVLLGALGIAKTLGGSDESAMGMQMWACLSYFCVSYFGGTIADDEAAKGAAAGTGKAPASPAKAPGYTSAPTSPKRRAASPSPRRGGRSGRKPSRLGD